MDNHDGYYLKLSPRTIKTKTIPYLKKLENFKELQWGSNIEGTTSLVNPLMLKTIIHKLSSGSMILLEITSRKRIILQNIGRRVVGIIMIDISPSKVFPTMLFLKDFTKIVRLFLAAVSVNGLKILTFFKICHGKKTSTV